jgi:hypothetical protein
MRRLTNRLHSLSLLVVLAALLPLSSAQAQRAEQFGVRGNLYESPTYGWILIAQQPDWRIVDAASANGVDTVHLASSLGHGADEFFVSRIDDGRGTPGCAQDIVDSLAAMFPGYELQGWHQAEVEFNGVAPDEHVAYARVISGEDPQHDVLAYVDCTNGKDDLLIGALLLRTAGDFDAGIAPVSETPSWPGDGHTGRAHRVAPPDGDDNPGVVRFLARNWPANQSGYPFPFSCIDQESFTRPAEPPPPDLGWYACDGQIANVDVVPVTIDLANIVIGCENLAPGDGPSGCPSAPVAPSYFEVISGPSPDGGSTLSLAPGESVDVVLWYALPGGDPPPQLSYVEPDRTVLVGPTFFTQGTGTRIPVIVSR